MGYVTMPRNFRLRWYTHRVVLSNERFVRMDPRTATFLYKDYRQGGALREMTLSGAEFVRRLSLHILPPGCNKIRHYGNCPSPIPKGDDNG